MAANKEIDQQLADEFCSLRDSWRREILSSSSMIEMVDDSNYQKIIALGEQVLPLIFEDMEREPDHWFFALREITGEDPVNDEDSGDLEKMTKSWLEWWKNKNGE